jgi:HEAT repeat protein
MARSDSAMIRRVNWFALAVALLAITAPRVTAKVEEQRDNRQWTEAEIAAARAQRRVYRLDRSGTSFDERWQQARADAGKQRFGDFWIAYSFTTPTHAGDMMISDSRDGGVWFSDGRVITQGPPLAELINQSAVPLEGGNVVVLLHYRGDAIDRAGYRSAQVGFDFGRTPVFWLGEAPDGQSFARVENLFGQARDRKIQTLLIDLASLHSNSNVVIPFLARLVDRKWPVEIRREAAEGFAHHHDPRSVKILLDVARGDADSSVRAEAAETIGEVQTPQSIPALMDLATRSTDPDVRREAAEGFGDQPANRALPAIEKVVATTEFEDVLNEAIEAIGELHDPSGLPLLVRIANTHRSLEAQKEAVETIGEIDVPGILEALTRIAWEHPNAEVQKEAVETLGDQRDDEAAIAAVEKIAREHEREEVQAEAIETIADFNDQAVHPLLLELAVSGRSARIRRQALESIGDAVSNTSDVQVLDRAQTAIERAVFDDPDRSVQAEAIDALDEFPNDRALRVLRDIVARHPDTRIRREAGEHLRERQ